MSLLHNIGTGLLEERLLSPVVPAGGDDESLRTCKSNKTGDPAKGIVENKIADVDATIIKGILRKRQEDEDDGEPHHCCQHCGGAKEMTQDVDMDIPGSTTMPTGSLPNNSVACTFKRCTPHCNNAHMGDLSPVHLWDGSIAHRRKSVVGREGKYMDVPMAGGDTKVKRSSPISKSKSCKDAKNLEDSLSTVETAELSMSMSSSCSIEDVVLRMIEKYSLLEMPHRLAHGKEGT